MATAAGILEKCNNCNLMDETEKVKLSFCSRCQLVLYCSQECPKQAWKSQKKICRIVSKFPLVNLATLKLNTCEPLYFNSALGYASKYMSGLRHVVLIFHQHHVLKNQQDYYMVPTEDNEKIKLRQITWSHFFSPRMEPLNLWSGTWMIAVGATLGTWRSSQAWSQSVEDVEPCLLECTRLVQYVTAAKGNLKVLLLDSLV
jgi:hypothetical protein